MYEYDSRIGFSSCDIHRKLTPAGLIDMFQDCSTFQSEDIGFGFDVLERQNLAWVINYWEINVSEMPCLCDRVKVGTFPYKINRFFAYRNFYMKNEKGDIIIKANTLWTLLNMEKTVPSRISREHEEAYSVEEKLDMTYSDRKVEIPQGDDISVSHKEAIVVGPHHLDSNKHVNNGQYVKIALEAAMFEESFKSLRIDYRKQAVLGDVIVPIVYTKDKTVTVALSDETGGIFSVMEIR